MSGAWLNITTGQDNSGNGLNAQRPNQVSDDVYGAKTIDGVSEQGGVRAAGARHVRRPPDQARSRDPERWTIDLALSRNINLSRTQNVELRLGVVQPAEPLQLGQPGDESESRDVRTHHDDAGNAARSCSSG